jgi:tetratricopeptide (TPR) repeat protein
MRIDRVARFVSVWVFIFGAAFAFNASVVQAQTPTFKPSTDQFKDESFAIEYYRKAIRFEADGTGATDLKVSIRVQSEPAVRQFGLLAYAYNASFESLEVIYVRVRKPDGTVVDTPAADVQDLDSAVTREAPMYTDQREKHIPVKALTVGDTVEVSLRWTLKTPVAPGHFWNDEMLPDDGICLDYNIEFDVPADPATKTVAPSDKLETKQNGTRRIYTIHSTHLEKAVHKSDDDVIPAWEKDANGAPPPVVRLSSFQSWADVGSWYRELQKSRVEITPQIRSTADEITKGKTTDEEKIRAIYQYVSSRIRYIGIDLGVSRYTPHSAEDVLNNRYGDCKDKHTLFAALLEAENIHAWPVLIGSKMRIDTDMPSPSTFDHVISAIPKGDSYIFLDTTPETAPYGLLPANLRGRQALVIPSGSPAKLVTIPQDSPVPNSEAYNMDATLDATGTLDGKARLELHGDVEILFRAIYRNAVPSQWDEVTEKILHNMGFAGTVQDVTVTPVEKTEQPFQLNYSYHRKEYSDWKDHQITLPFPPMFLPSLNSAQKKSKEPLVLGGPAEFTYEASLKLPQGFSPQLPGDTHQQTDFLTYDSTYSLGGGVVHGKRSLKIKKREVSAEQRAAYSTFVKAMDEDFERWIVLIGNFSAADPQREADKLVRDGKIAEAIALLEKTIEENPDKKMLEFDLGAAYLRSSDVGDAVKASAHFERFLGDHPDPYALNNVAWEYADANIDLPKALELASRAVAELAAQSNRVDLNAAMPRDFDRTITMGSAWDTYGWALFRSGDLPAAEKYLESAWLLSMSPETAEHLAELYEKIGAKREAYLLCQITHSNSSNPDVVEALDRMKKLEARLGTPKATTSPEKLRIHITQGNPIDMRLFQLPKKTAIPQNLKSATLAVEITNGETVSNIRFLDGDKNLMPFAQDIATLNFHQPFPNDKPAKILRLGWLTCSKYVQHCSFVLSELGDQVKEAAVLNGPQ